MIEQYRNCLVLKTQNDSQNVKKKFGPVGRYLSVLFKNLNIVY